MLNLSVSPEEARLAALRRYHILDTPADPAFDRLTELAARQFAVPYAAITFVEADRVWAKSCFGLSFETIPRLGSFCECTLATGGVFVAEDVGQERRFADNPFVAGPPFLRFYAGAPLSTPDGFTIGVLCLADSAPRPFPEDLRASLISLADFVMREVELHQALHRLETEAASQVAEAAAPYAAERQNLPPVYLRLQKAYNELEVWVGQRTAALERANHALEHEVAERQRGRRRWRPPAPSWRTGSPSAPPPSKKPIRSCGGRSPSAGRRKSGWGRAASATAPCSSRTGTPSTRSTGRADS